jgi:F-type H+-transporting ATPase subunit alpha
MAIVLFAGTQGYLDDLKISEIRAFEDGLHKYFESAQSALVQSLTEKKQIDDDIRTRLHAALKEYKENFKATQKEAVTA